MFTYSSSGRVTNLVKRDIPNLGVSSSDLIGTSLSLNFNYESSPTGTITFEAIRQSDIGTYRRLYKEVGTKLRIYPWLEMEVAGYAESQNRVHGRDIEDIVSYDISVSLRGYHEEALSNNPKVNECNKGISKASKTTLKQVANLAKISYEGFDTSVDLGEVNADTTINFKSILDNYKTLKGYYVDYHSKTIKTKKLNAGNRYFVPKNNIIYAIESTSNKPITYNVVELKGINDFKSKNETVKKFIESLKNNLVKKPPLEIELIEGDENPDVAPKGIDIVAGQAEVAQVSHKYNVQDLSLNFDKSGPRKTRRTITTLNGQPYKERIESWGFAYLAIDIENPEAYDPEKAAYVPPLLGKSPTFEGFWKKIEDRTTRYIYKPIESEVGLEAKEKEGDKETSLGIFYLNSKDSFSSSPSSFNSHKYLVERSETGWKLGRFLTEEINLEGDIDTTTDTRVLWHEVLSKPSNDPSVDPLEREYAQLTWSALQFRKFTVNTRQIYSLADSNKYYKDLKDVPYRTEQVKLKDIVSQDNTGRLDLEKEVVIAVPDPNYVYPLMSLQEEELTQGIHTHPNPRNVFIKDTRKEIQESSDSEADKIAALKENPLLPELIVGEDSYSKTYRKILPSKNTKKETVGVNENIDYDWFSEYSSAASSQDDDFRSSFSQVQFKQSLGRPSTPSVLSDQYESPEEDEDKKQDDKKKDKRYFLLSSNVGKNTEVDEKKQGPKTDLKCLNITSTIEFPTDNLKEAIEGAVNQLKLDNWLNASETRINLAYYYPELLPGDYLSVADMPGSSRYRIKSVGFTVTWQGIVEGEQIITCDGTSVTCGIWDDELNVELIEKSKDEEEKKLKIKPNMFSAEEINQTFSFTPYSRRYR